MAERKFAFVCWLSAPNSQYLNERVKVAMNRLQLIRFVKICLFDLEI